MDFAAAHINDFVTIFVCSGYIGYLDIDNCMSSKRMLLCFILQINYSQVSPYVFLPGNQVFLTPMIRLKHSKHSCDFLFTYVITLSYLSHLLNYKSYKGTYQYVTVSQELSIQ